MSDNVMRMPGLAGGPMPGGAMPGGAMPDAMQAGMLPDQGGMMGGMMGGMGAPGDELTMLMSPPPEISHADIEAIVRVWVNEAQVYDDRLSVIRAESLRHYNGEPQGDEESGRSQIVTTEVRDTIGAMMPSVIRIFAGADTPVEFAPRQAEDVPAAEQALAYVQFVAFEENDGFRAIHDACLDAFQLKTGWLHWYWDESFTQEAESYRGLLDVQAKALVMQPGVKAVKATRRPASEEEMAGFMGSPESQVVQIQPGAPMMLYDVDLKRIHQRSDPKFVSYPSEQVLIDPRATTVKDGRFLFLWQDVYVSDLIALGMDRDTVLAHLSTDMPSSNRVRRRRDPVAAYTPQGATSRDPAMRQVRYWQGWIKIDMDGDGLAELRYVRLIGRNALKLMDSWPASEIPWAAVNAYLVPHRVIGESMDDRVGDLQKIGTRVVRNILDSMAESIHPRTVIKEGRVNVDDVMNTEMGAVIRENETNAVRELTKPFIGPQAMPILEMLANLKETRTGISRASQGLTADALQSTTAIAVSATVAAAQDCKELVIRVLAESLKEAYLGLVGMMATHQDRPRMVMLRGKWVVVDPRPWRNAFRTTVKVGVGRGTTVDRIQALGMVAGKQEVILQTLGPDNPLVTLGQYRAALCDALIAAGVIDTDRYFKPLPIDYKMPPVPKPPDPNLLLAQANLNKVAADAADDHASRRIDMLKVLLEDDRLRDIARVQAVLDAAKLNLEGGTLEPAALSVMLDRDLVPPTMALGLAMIEPQGEAQGQVMPGAPGPAAPGGPQAPSSGGMPSLVDAAPPGAGAQPGGFLDPRLISALAGRRQFAFLPAVKPVGPTGNLPQPGA